MNVLSVRAKVLLCFFIQLAVLSGYTTGAPYVGEGKEEVSARSMMDRRMWEDVMTC